MTVRERRLCTATRARQRPWPLAGGLAAAPSNGAAMPAAACSAQLAAPQETDQPRLWPLQPYAEPHRCPHRPRIGLHRWTGARADAIADVGHRGSRGWTSRRASRFGRGSWRNRGELVRGRIQRHRRCPAICRGMAVALPCHGARPRLIEHSGGSCRRINGCRTTRALAARA